MTTAAAEARNREIVRQIYEASFNGDRSAFPAAMHEDFEESIPPILPWGGVYRDRDAFERDMFPKLRAVVDFASFQLVSLSADGDHVAALLTARSIAGEEIWVAEHWIMRDEKVWRMRVFYFDTIPLQS